MYFHTLNCISKGSCTVTFLSVLWMLLKILIIVPSLSSRLVAVHITFVLNAINLQTVRHRELPDCYDFAVIVRPMTSVPDSAHTSGARQTFTSSYLTRRVTHLTATPDPRAATSFHTAQTAVVMTKESLSVPCLFKEAGFQICAVSKRCCVRRNPVIYIVQSYL